MNMYTCVYESPVPLTANRTPPCISIRFARYRSKCNFVPSGIPPPPNSLITHTPGIRRVRVILVKFQNDDDDPKRSSREEKRRRPSDSLDVSLSLSLINSSRKANKDLTILWMRSVRIKVNRIRHG